MATYTDSLGFNKGVASYPERGEPTTTMLEVVLDMAQIAAARAAAGATALTTTDILEVLQIPAKTMVLHVGLDVTKAAGATLTVDVGDGADRDGYLDGVNANTIASYANPFVLAEGAPNTVVGFGAGKYYAAADTIDVVFNNAPGAAIMRLWALVVDCN